MYKANVSVDTRDGQRHYHAIHGATVEMIRWRAAQAHGAGDVVFVFVGPLQRVEQ